MQVGLGIVIGVAIADRVSEGDMVRVIALYRVPGRRGFGVGDLRAAASRASNPAY